MTKEEKAAYMREWRRKNKEKVKETNKKYRNKHKEEAIEYHKQWRNKNREKLRVYYQNKYKEDSEAYKKRNIKYRETHQEQEKERRRKYKQTHKKEVYEYEMNRRKNPINKLKLDIRCLIKNTFLKKHFKKNTKTEKILGCSLDFFIEYLQSKFQEGMTLENHGLWHIDHIKPIALATTEEEVIKLNHYTNLQPLWAKDNLKKGAKYLEGSEI